MEVVEEVLQKKVEKGCSYHQDHAYVTRKSLGFLDWFSAAEHTTTRSSSTLLEILAMLDFILCIVRQAAYWLLVSSFSFM